jgi:UDP-glucose 4-epimerase
MKKILVTGAAGYIGSHTCVELLNEGHEIVAIDNLSNSKAVALERVRKITGKDFPFFNGDVCDTKILREIFRANSIGSVIHFAGYKAVGESVEIPLKYYENNLISTIHLCRIMDEFDIRKIVFSSSATVYGACETVPIREDAPLWCTNPYGWTKFMNERILEDLAVSDSRWSVVLLRYFNPIGAHESGLIGEDPNGIPNNLVPYIAQVAIGKLEVLPVYGDDYPTKDGTGVRDYIHVVDLAKGHLRAIEYAESLGGSDTINLGTGIGYSVFEMVKAFEKASGLSIPYTVVGRRPGDVASCYADPQKARDVLGWKTEKDIEQMCADTWRWQTMNPQGYI